MTARLVIAGTSSGAGKTTVASGLIAALRRAGHHVQGFKVGPDYIDPSYHRLASGRPGRNLDAFLSGPELIAPLFRHGAAGADISVIEGVMGMFDGASGRGELASTAHVAKLLDAPVVLVVDGSAMARSAAAVVHGFRTFDPGVQVAGVIFNRVGSDSHAALLREAVEQLSGPPLPVLGCLPRDPALSTPERHLGLVPAVEREPRAAAALARLAEAVGSSCELDALQRLAAAAPALPGAAWSPAAALPDGAPGLAARVAVARGPAFSFHYQENLELLTAAGAELLPFDPLTDECLPAGADALLLAGGFPEVFGAELAANLPLHEEVVALARAGRPVLAECGGLLYLARELDGHRMCGVLPLRGHMSGRLTLGYREAEAATTTPWLDAGEKLRGHEFHFSEVEPQPECDLLPAWQLSARGRTRREGCVLGSVQASYLHVHWSAYPRVAARFARAAARPPSQTGGA